MSHVQTQTLWRMPHFPGSLKGQAPTHPGVLLLWWGSLVCHCSPLWLLTFLGHPASVGPLLRFSWWIGCAGTHEWFKRGNWSRHLFNLVGQKDSISWDLYHQKCIDHSGTHTRKTKWSMLLPEKFEIPLGQKRQLSKQNHQAKVFPPLPVWKLHKWRSWLFSFLSLF